jgi:hypothetical protein
MLEERQEMKKTTTLLVAQATQQGATCKKGAKDVNCNECGAYSIFNLCIAVYAKWFKL